MQKDKFLKFLIFFFLVSFFFPYPLYYITSQQKKSSISYFRIQDLLDETQDFSLEKRIDAISQNFLGRRYESPALGEGEGSYQNLPMHRFDKFDCTTYVETVIALSNSSNIEDFERHMRQIRYRDGLVGFVTRNHFPSLDWIPNNIRAGYLKDVTSKVAKAPHNVQIASSSINKKDWYKKVHNSQLDVFLDSNPHEDSIKAHLPYLSYDKIFLQVDNAYLKNEVRLHKEKLQKDFKALDAHKRAAKEIILRDDLKELDYFYKRATSKINDTLLSRMPNVSVLNIVRFDPSLSEKIGTLENVFHQGILIRKDDDLVLRHASSLSGKVIEERFEDALDIYLIDPTMRGVNILSVSAKDEQKIHARNY